MCKQIIEYEDKCTEIINVDVIQGLSNKSYEVKCHVINSVLCNRDLRDIIFEHKRSIMECNILDVCLEIEYTNAIQHTQRQFKNCMLRSDTCNVLYDDDDTVMKEFDQMLDYGRFHCFSDEAFSGCIPNAYDYSLIANKYIHKIKLKNEQYFNNKHSKLARKLRCAVVKYYNIMNDRFDAWANKTQFIVSHGGKEYKLFNKKGKCIRKHTNEQFVDKFMTYTTNFLNDERLMSLLKTYTGNKHLFGKCKRNKGFIW